MTTTKLAPAPASLINRHRRARSRAGALTSALIASAAALSALGGSTGCTAFVDKRQVVSAAPEPARTLPALDDERPAPRKGRGRVVFDVTDGPATIQLVAKAPGEAGGPPAGAAEGDEGDEGDESDESAAESGARSRVLCVTPCAVDLPRGRHAIQIARNGVTDEGVVQVGAAPVAYRHTMTQITASSGGKRAVTATMMTTGLVAAAVGGLLLNYSDATAQGLSTLLGGSGLVIGAHFMSVSNRTIERPGSSVQWQLPAIKF